MGALFSEVRTRLLAGRRAYGDRSFSKDPRELLEEVEQELLDVCGWSYVLYRRVAEMRDALRNVSPGAAHDTTPAPPPFARADDGPLDRWKRARHDSSPLGRLCGAERGTHS